MSIFKGFSTVNKENPPFTLVDIELVKQDLLNTFYTKKGERVMRPEFGSNIPLYVMDPLDEVTLELIEQDIYDVIETEPRVSMETFDIQIIGQSVIIRILLFFKSVNITDEMYLTYRRDAQGL